ncbi:hypothetical protein J7E24_13700 [Hymenobacter sp. ISL-91]|uniref:hypothetical protein n=1 Tax=Hymenobacter sp. ISL-91 TaxID=2819151 RepID=UPI001BEC4AAD|nr:hypothetical protein [Hymenobacter sp. ISL-91]MBT2558845.1 hypothetical protein [Hymenobacter sp. ISL-91]
MKRIAESDGAWVIEYDDYFNGFEPINKEQIASLICYLINSRTPLGDEIQKSMCLIKHIDSLHILTQYVEYKGEITRIHFIDNKNLSIFCIDFPSFEIIKNFLDVFFEQNHQRNSNGFLKMVSGLPCHIKDMYSAPSVIFTDLLELLPKGYDSLSFHSTRQDLANQHRYIEQVETKLIFFSNQKSYSFNIENHIRRSLSNVNKKVLDPLIISINHKMNRIDFSYTQDKNLYWHKYESSEWKGSVNLATFGVEVECVYSEMYSSR